MKDTIGDVRFAVFVSQLAEHESWRKEVYRPIYHIHKWWANRLGSVFRAIIIATCFNNTEKIESLFYKPLRFPEITIFDPFIGSGTTIGEAIKLGCKVIGRDINPVSLIMTTAAFQYYNTKDVEQQFQELSQSAGKKIRSIYTVELSNGENAEVLYYFWVRTVPCPNCREDVDLFKTRIFSKNAYPERRPESKACCPHCGAINEVRYDAVDNKCSACKRKYNPQQGTVQKSNAICSSCKMVFKIIDAVRLSKSVPDQKMYAKLVLHKDGSKSYHAVDDYDRKSYEKAEKNLHKIWKNIPKDQIKKGYNTNQILKYNYKYWHQMFNARQLVCMWYIISEIKKIENPELRLLFACLFSGALEFNNMFTSFKGEGTGAVRPLFYHHILKPEFMPIEANLWGTTKSSGSFSTLYRTRVLRGIEYKSNPFEIAITSVNGKRQVRKIFGLSEPVNKKIVHRYKQFSGTEMLYLSAGDSSKIDLDNNSVDFIVTDPPFFDNVHYSQLADFFYVWLKQIPTNLKWLQNFSTRSPLEVQNTSAETFTERLSSVFSECKRIMKKRGLLVFTYHHSRKEGWFALYKAVRSAGFTPIKSIPVKSEMSVSVPIQQSRNPITYDLIFTCTKEKISSTVTSEKDQIVSEALTRVRSVIDALQSATLKMSSADIKAMLMGYFLVILPRVGNLDQELSLLQMLEKDADNLVERIMNNRMSKNMTALQKSN